MRCISSTSSFSGLNLRAVAEKGQFQPEARENGAQIVADAGQHGGALLDMARDAVRHVEKGLARLRTSAAPRGWKFADVAARAEALRRLGQIDDRA